MERTAVVWRLLCVLTIMSGLLAVTGILWALSPMVQAVVLAPDVLVLVCVAVASRADSSPRSDG